MKLFQLTLAVLLLVSMLTLAEGCIPGLTYPCRNYNCDEVSLPGDGGGSILAEMGKQEAEHVDGLDGMVKQEAEDGGTLDRMVKRIRRRS